MIADEINRASPNEFALLEVMGERTVTVDGSTHPVAKPFLVVATQNPVDMEGTYALPEAQLDRFLMRISLGHLDPEDELGSSRVTASAGRWTISGRSWTSHAQQIIAMTTQVRVADALGRYAVALAKCTRRHRHVRHGASTRATLALVQAARARACLHGRNYATADDVQVLAVPVFAHRLMLAPQAELEGVRQADVIREALHTPAPDTAGSRR